MKMNEDISNLKGKRKLLTQKTKEKKKTLKTFDKFVYVIFNIRTSKKKS